MAIVVLKKFYETDLPTTSASPVIIATINLASFEGINISAIGRLVIAVDVEMFAFRDVAATSTAQKLTFGGVLCLNSANTAIVLRAQNAGVSLGDSIITAPDINTNNTYAFTIEGVSNTFPNSKLLTRATITIYDT